MARVAKLTLLYYAVTTTLAVVLGIALVDAIRPGRGNALGTSASAADCHGQAVQVIDNSIIKMKY